MPGFSPWVHPDGTLHPSYRSFREIGRVVECTGLENRRTLIAFPGFESLVSRHTRQKKGLERSEPFFFMSKKLSSPVCAITRSNSRIASRSQSGANAGDEPGTKRAVPISLQARGQRHMAISRRDELLHADPTKSALAVWRRNVGPDWARIVCMKSFNPHHICAVANIAIVRVTSASTVDAAILAVTSCSATL